MVPFTLQPRNTNHVPSSHHSPSPSQFQLSSKHNPTYSYFSTVVPFQSFRIRAHKRRIQQRAMCRDPLVLEPCAMPREVLEQVFFCCSRHFDESVERVPWT